MILEEIRKQYIPTIGLEIHFEPKTKQKMFCNCLNDPNETIPNKNICPICLAHPGVLPTVNKEAIEMILKLGLALNCEILKISRFDRKNYFYPDLPKSYQITQAFLPFCKNGKLIPFLEDNISEVKIKEIHLEEDTGKLLHEGDQTLIDYNRASRPLIELVTEACIHDGKTARVFAESLQVILRSLDISDADMEKGQMRVEVNVSVSKDEKLGIKAEVKNINSFKAAEKAIDYEIERQIELLEKGDKINQETRGWDDTKSITFSQRIKEGADDYRYFPDPDLPEIIVYGENGLFDIEKLKNELGELPYDKKTRLMNDYGIAANKAIFLVVNDLISDCFEQTVREVKKFFNDQEKINKANNLIYNYLVTDILGWLTNKNILFNDLKISVNDFAKLINLIVEDKISSRGAKIILEKMIDGIPDPEKIMKDNNLEQVSNDVEIEKMITEVLAENQKSAEEYKSGKTAVIQFLIGKTMAKAKGAGNPGKIKEIIEKMLN